MPEITESRYLVEAGWRHVPHLTEQAKADMLRSTLPHLRQARSEGIPALGAGAIFPWPLEDLLIPPARIPKHWPRAYALDVGWRRTAAVWGAWNLENDCLVLYAEHYMGQAPPVIHAAAIRARGEWINGLIDPAARGRAQDDGMQMMAQYVEHGLKLTPADNAVEAGLEAMWDRITTGRLKVVSSLLHWQAEYRLYRRDEKGRIVKENDHLLDGTRYLVLAGRAIAQMEGQDRGMHTSAGIVADQVAGY
jgi:hypothetical protein